ncbi:MAG: NAD(P)H-dependent oxidoreductase subunit E [Gemmatimonadaceae bacterium]|nr:NAD(P)H-dependent oxidoreductase subunit E [Gemmatimonadaceae bacterium]
MTPADPDRELSLLHSLLATTPPDAEHLLPFLQQVQRECGYISPAAIRFTAHAFNLSRAEVYGVVTFYGDLREAPVGDVVVQLCMAEACQAAGAREMAAQVRQELASPGASHRVHVEDAFCFGNCALSPAVRVGDMVYGGMDAARVRDVVATHIARDSAVVGESAFVGAARANPRAVVYLPNDTAARSIGADAVAAALVAGYPDLTVVRNGSRGAYFLEPLLEMDTDDGRIGFANVGVEDLETLFGGGRLPSATHTKCIGRVESHPWLRAQQRHTFARAGRIDPLSLTDYRAYDGLRALEHALALPSPQGIIDELQASGLRGRGGAAFPAAIKWQTVHNAASPTKYVVCNADEGDSGTFADRLLMEADPFQLIEGMIIAGVAVGATRGFVYLRSEYPHTIDVMTRALQTARDEGVLGPSVMGSSHAFDITLRVGGGAYICGEETALLESLEGKRGVVRAKPPLPALEGLFGQPTVVNNVLTLAAVTTVLQIGGAAYAAHGVGRSTGTMPFQLGGNVKCGGLVEVPFGITLRALVEQFGEASYSGRPLKAIQVGGPLGAYLPASQWDTPLTYEAMAAVGAMLGHGGIVVFDDTVDMGAQAEFAMAFCAHESCGKCTPCRIGSTRGVEVISRIRRGEQTRKNWQLLTELCETMELGSLCALGGLTPMPVRSVMTHFPGDLMSSSVATAAGAAERNVPSATTVLT